MTDKTPQFKLKELVFDVSDLYRQDAGSLLKYDVDVVLPFLDDAAEPKSNLEGEIQLLKTQDTIECVLNNMSIDLEVPCDKCLKRFIQTIRIPYSERTFFVNAEDRENEEDMLIDRKRLELDTNELVRQEIILHFPIVLVCSDGCQGIGSHPVSEANDERKPLSALKDMWKSN